VALTILAQPEQWYVLEASTDTTTWAPLGTNLSQTALLNFLDRTSPGADLRFYRVRQLGR
jgi:hypothetical protein